MVKYCKRPLDLPGEVGDVKAGEVIRVQYFFAEAFEGTGFKCGTWMAREISQDPEYYYYICKRCLQKQGLVW